jgi:integrating conjugative element protein (TIGR03765 family)
MFIVGDDPHSARWLSTSADLLRSLRAIGFVVNVENEERMRHLRAIVPGVQLVPAVVDDFATSIGLVHYPALITPTGIEQ